VGITAAEIILALLVAWGVIHTQIAQHASGSNEFQPGDWFILGSMLACLALFAFVLASWQWRLTARGRFRLLACLFVSLVGAFGGLCWYDVSVRAAALTPLAQQPSAMEQLTERTAAAAVSMAALAFGLIALVVVVRLDRRRPRGDAAQACPERSRRETP
jgi:hypothetical protein